MRRRRAEPEVAGELNLVPYMDIVVNLILFLMLSSTGFISFASVSAGVVSTDGPAPTDTQRTLSLVVKVTPQGLELSGDNVAISIPGHDYAALTAALTKLKSHAVNETRIIVTANPDTPYDIIIRVSDAARGDPKHPLFPDLVIKPAE